MLITKIEHIGIAVRSIDEMLRLYSDTLGLKLQGIEVMEDQKVRTAIIQVGESKIELLESIGSEGPIVRHLETRGEGLHHLALEVDDIEDALETLEKRGVSLVDKQPRKGVGNARIAFLHPKETKVLLELVETKQ